jgi:glucan phosphoethanolaminetransferase (alkaline phosphatase superfamily)
VIKLKKLTAAAILICINAAYAAFEGIWALAATESYIQTWAEMMETTAKESAVLTMAVQFFGVYHLVALVSLAIIAMIPLRRAEKWAWVTILVLGGIGLGFGIALWAPYAPFMYVFFAMWVAALALSAKPCLGRKE